MNNPSNFFWIAFYFGQNCILHPKTGRWTLSGFFDNQVVCKKNIGTADEDCQLYPISEIQFILKQGNPFLIRALSKLPNSYEWMKNKALSGYWVFYETDFKQVIFEN
jgi:hypothetical protein